MCFALAFLAGSDLVFICSLAMVCAMCGKWIDWKIEGRWVEAGKYVNIIFEEEERKRLVLFDNILWAAKCWQCDPTQWSPCTSSADSRIAAPESYKACFARILKIANEKREELKNRKLIGSSPRECHRSEKQPEPEPEKGAQASAIDMKKLEGANRQRNRIRKKRRMSRD